MFSWLKWFFWDKRRCEHAHGTYRLEDLGRTKVLWCDDCGAALEVNGIKFEKKALVFKTEREHN